LQALHQRFDPEFPVNYHLVQNTVESDALLNALSPGALVINATGMGKDLPGSPISHVAQFPPQAIVWELNYRGELTFLHQARTQQQTQQLQLESGWNYFIHGWTQVIAEVFTLPADAVAGDAFLALSTCAASISGQENA
jgi:shikimate 5-dehydrogenase